MEELIRLREENRQLRAVLSQYADNENWHGPEFIGWWDTNETISKRWEDRSMLRLIHEKYYTRTAHPYYGAERLLDELTYQECMRDWIKGEKE